MTRNKSTLLTEVPIEYLDKDEHDELVKMLKLPEGVRLRLYDN